MNSSKKRWCASWTSRWCRARKIWYPFGFRICPYWASAVRMFFRCCIFWAQWRWSMGHSNRAYWIMCFALSNQNGAVVIEAEEGNMPTALRKSKSFDNLSDFCTLSDFAAVFGISKATAYRMADQGRIPCIRLGKRIILSKNHLKQWIDAEIGFEIQSTTTEDIENG